MPDLTTYILTSIIFFVGAFLQSIVGFGFNVLGVPSLTILTNARNAVTVVSIPSFLNCLLLVWRTPVKIPLKAGPLVPLLITCAIGTLVGATMLKSLDPSIVLTSLGILLLLYVLTARLRKNWQPNPEHGNRLALAVGLATGILNGLAGVSGPTLAPYLHALRLEKIHFVYYLNVLFLFLGVFQFFSFGLLGFFTWERIEFGLSLIPISLAGLYLGYRMRSRVSQEFFNRLVLAVLFLTALDLIRRGLNVTF